MRTDRFNIPKVKNEANICRILKSRSKPKIAEPYHVEEVVRPLISDHVWTRVHRSTLAENEAVTIRKKSFISGGSRKSTNNVLLCKFAPYRVCYQCMNGRLRVVRGPRPSRIVFY